MLIGVLHTGKRPFSAEELRNGVSRRGLNLTTLNAALTQLHAG